MKIQKMISEQKEFQKNFYDPENLTDKDRIMLTKETILCLHKEIDEVLDTINWKIHRKINKDNNREELKEEMVDCFKYLLNLCVIWDISPEEFNEAFERKSKIVWERFSKENDKSSL